LNPNPKPYIHVIPKQNKRGDWECKKCHQKFESRTEMRKHFREEHKELTRSRELKICNLCGQEYVNIRKHNQVCPNKEHHHKFTDAEKKELSMKRIAYLKANPDKHPWKDNSKFKSKPCEQLKAYLRDRNISFEEEYTDSTWDRNYSLDIAIVDRKIDLEVNGNQHYNNGKLKEKYQKRHDYLESLGWMVLEIPYLNCFKENELQKIFEKVSQ
jgi:very-short-patch-repair endonuclease